MCHPKHFLSQTLGFVSLVVFLVERSWVPNGKSAIDLIAESLNLGYMLKKTLHRLHFQLFGVSVRIPQERSLEKIVFKARKGQAEGDACSCRAPSCF